MTNTTQDTTQLHAEAGQLPKKTTKTRQWWHEHYKSWETSGLSKSEYCQRHDLKPVSFYKWSSTFNGESNTKAQAADRSHTSPGAIDFIRATVTPEPKSCLVASLSVGDVSLVFKEGIHDKDVLHWVKTIKRAC